MKESQHKYTIHSLRHCLHVLLLLFCFSLKDYLPPIAIIECNPIEKVCICMSVCGAKSPLPWRINQEKKLNTVWNLSIAYGQRKFATSKFTEKNCSGQRVYASHEISSILPGFSQLARHFIALIAFILFRTIYRNRMKFLISFISLSSTYKSHLTKNTKAYTKYIILVIFNGNRST